MHADLRQWECLAVLRADGVKEKHRLHAGRLRLYYRYGGLGIHIPIGGLPLGCSPCRTTPQEAFLDHGGSVS